MSEATFAVDPTQSATGIDNRKLGMWIFLASEVMLFSALIGALAHMKALSPATANDVLNIPVTALNTFILIISSFTVAMSLQFAQENKQGRLRLFLVLTMLLGMTFLSIQMFEYRELIHEGFTPASSVFAGAFYTVTGFHGFHVFLGVVLVIWLLPQAFRGRFGPENYMRIEIYGLYWHFVDIVWIILFTLIYLL
jgi:cytochrome c oxidase subunit 3/cytochrome o ubiquinol oxidase subunit 3